jgi:hypothetical protein
VFTYRLETNYEYTLFDLYCLCVGSNGFGVSIDYVIVKDYCKKYEFDSIEMLRKMKRIVGEIRD